MPQRAVLAKPLTAKEAVLHQALAKQKEHDHQDSYKNHLENSAGEWFSLRPGR